MNATPERILQAEWVQASSLTHAVDIEIEALDRPGLLQDVMGVCAEVKTSVSSVTARVRTNRGAVIAITAQITDLDHLHKLLKKFEGIRDVRAVFRVTKREARVSSEGTATGSL